MFYNTSPPRMFLSLDLLWEYRIQHGANGPLYITSSYSTWIFCRGVSGFATDCSCGVWSRGLTTCLLHVGPPFGNRIFGFTFLNILYFFKYFCTNIFHRRSLYTFYLEINTEMNVHILQRYVDNCCIVRFFNINLKEHFKIESIKTTSMEDVSTRVLEKIKNM